MDFFQTCVKEAREISSSQVVVDVPSWRPINRDKVGILFVSAIWSQNPRKCFVVCLEFKHLQFFCKNYEYGCACFSCLSKWLTGDIVKWALSS